MSARGDPTRASLSLSEPSCSSQPVGPALAVVAEHSGNPGEMIGESDVILFGGSFGGIFWEVSCEINEKPTPKNEERVSETFYFFKLLEGFKSRW